MADNERIARALKEADGHNSILGFSPIQAAFGFCAVAGLGTLLILPLAPGVGTPNLPVAQQNVAFAPGSVDNRAVGSVAASAPKRRYKLRRSVLNADPKETCMIYDDGSREGSCPSHQAPTKTLLGQ